MLWVLWDIVLPLLATFLLGLCLGWLLWRWRRSRIDADDLSMLRRTSARFKADSERLQQSNIELSERLQAAGGSAGQALDDELSSAQKRIDMLADELKKSRTEVAELRRAGSDRRVNKTSADLAASAGDLDLHEEIAARDRMIATLEKSLQQFGDSGDTTALMADIVIRDRKIEELEALLKT